MQVAAGDTKSTYIDPCIIRACADDVGVALYTIEYLKELHTCYSDIHDIANLTLKPKKCIIVPLTCIVDDDTVQHIRTWLRQHIPDWADFRFQA